MVIDKVPMARTARSPARWRRAMAMVTGSSPSPTPWRPRPVTTTAKLFDTAASTQPAMTTTRAPRMTSRWRGPSARRPMIGVARAPVSRVMVRSHSAVPRVTWSARAIVGMSGAPRLLTMDINEPTMTRQGTRARSRHAGTSPPGPGAVPPPDDEDVPAGGSCAVGPFGVVRTALPFPLPVQMSSTDDIA